MTIDPFMLLAPVLLLAVIALLRFVGCDRVLGLEPIQPVPTDTPTIMSFDPPDATVGDGVSTPFELTVIGSNFAQGAKVKFGSTDLTPTSVTDSQIIATFSGTAPELESPGQVTVTVTNPDQTAGSKDFSVLELITVFFPGPGPNDHIPPGSTLNSDASQNWAWEPGTSDDPSSHIFFANGSGPGFLKFGTPRLLKSMEVGAAPAGGNLTVTDDNPSNLSPSPPGIDPVPPRIRGTPQLFTFNWKLKSTTVSVSFNNPNSLSIHKITYQGPV